MNNVNAVFQITKSPNHQITKSARGFSLIEIAIASVVIAIAVLSMVAAQQSFHNSTGGAAHAATALSLANEIREITMSLPMHDPITGAMEFGPEDDENLVVNYDDIDDFAAAVITPPINAIRESINDLTGWTQTVLVEYVNSDDIAGDPAVGQTDLMRITVVITIDDSGNPVQLQRLSWITAGQP